MSKRTRARLQALAEYKDRRNEFSESHQRIFDYLDAPSIPVIASRLGLSNARVRQLIASVERIIYQRENVNSFTDEETAWILDKIDDARYDLGLTEYKIFFNFTDEEVKDDGEPVIAQIDVNDEYLKADITFYPVALWWLRNKDNDRRVFLQTIYHELAHIFVDPLFGLVRDILGETKLTKAECKMLDKQRENIVERVSRVAYQARTI